MYDRQLLTFVRTAECGSLTKAAEALYLTSAAVMKQMERPGAAPRRHAHGAQQPGRGADRSGTLCIR